MNKEYFVYILANKNNNVIYTGVTNDLKRRVAEHKNKINDGFTKKYNVDKLVFYEKTGNVMTAILREKQIKSWSRKKKNDLIESMNPKWADLALSSE
ncbi:MAG: GIY-YIG nuclease family protein [Clostridia bacterium]|nr:GIY-YIG nuclease family protein [Clostridia bacterium]